MVVFPDFIRRAIVFSDDNIINYSLTQIKENTVNLFVDDVNWNILKKQKNQL